MMSPNSNQQQEQYHDSSSTPLAPVSHIRPMNVEQPRGQPTQSRSFRILQMIHDPADDSADTEAEPTENSGRLSRSSVGSNNSGGTSAGRSSQQCGPMPIGERRLNLTQDDRELMDMFRSQGNFIQSQKEKNKIITVTITSYIRYISINPKMLLYPLRLKMPYCTLLEDHYLKR